MCDLGVAELGLMEEHDEVSEEPEQSFEQMKIPTQRDRQKLSLGGKSAQDAENMAIKLLAKRLEFNYLLSWLKVFILVIETMVKSV